jgi:hypothetical protein
VAAGRFDGFWELKLMPWDTAAAWLLVEEAGGGVTDLRGGPYHLHSRNILASNGFFDAEMVRILAGTDPLFTPGGFLINQYQIIQIYDKQRPQIHTCSFWIRESSWVSSRNKKSRGTKAPSC